LSAQIEARIEQHFTEGVELRSQMSKPLAPLIARAAHVIAQSISSGGKILVCGNGGSAADSQHFAAEMICRLERERRALPAFALTTDTSSLTATANDYDFKYVFSRQVQGLGRPGDVLVAISTSGNSKNILEAIGAAHAGSIAVVALTGRDGGEMARILRDDDVHLNVRHDRTMRVQELHLTILHVLADAVECFLDEPLVKKGASSPA
jgi:D-sedoheptulose 7-phosphate isomerase